MSVKQGAVRTPVHDHGIRSRRHTGGSVAGDRHRPGDFVVVRTNGNRGTQREGRSR